ncbi:biopolymer transporter ExbD [Erythrobacter sp.]|uniref:ExbD/TolR family protein n=1 Tax=Erythrobacter sp. TaxID=1042 RepID=UPI00311E3CE5
MPYALRRRPTPSRPLSDMNVTPFIDVLLVLLIMLIMAVPVATHVTDIDLPSGPGPFVPNDIENTVAIDAGDRLYLNGNAVNRDDLSRMVQAASALPHELLLRFEPDAHASYDASAKTIALIKDSGVEHLAFIGNERHRSFNAD